MRVVGIDPGFASLGVVVAELPRGIDDLVFTKVGCVKTSKCKDISAAQDLTARAWDMAENLHYFIDEGRGEVHDVFAVCIEGMSYPRHTQAAVKLGAANGVVGAMVASWLPEVVYVEQPQHIRKRVLDIEKGKTPPEEDVHDYLLAHYPELADLMKDLRKGARPHILDAAACVVAAWKESRLS